MPLPRCEKATCIAALLLGLLMLLLFDFPERGGKRPSPNPAHSAPVSFGVSTMALASS